MANLRPQTSTTMRSGNICGAQLRALAFTATPPNPNAAHLDSTAFGLLPLWEKIIYIYPNLLLPGLDFTNLSVRFNYRYVSKSFYVRYA